MALKQLGIPYETVGISEIDKYAIQSYNAIHGETKNYGDICKMDQIPKCDIFTWSFPCTDLSKAGKQKGLTDTRSGLVYEVLRLLHATDDKPQVLIMENVVDLIQVKFIREFQEIQLEIEKMGYSCYTQKLNAKHYGVAQNRDRVFMVSILGEYSYKFPPKIKLEKRLKDYLETDVDEKYYLSDRAIKGIQNSTFNTTMRRIQEDNVCDTICARDYKDPKCVQVASLEGKGFNEMTARVYGSEELSPTIQTMGGGNREPKIAIPEATKQGYALASEGDGVYINRPHQKRGVVQKGMIQTIKTSGEDVGVVVKFKKHYSERSMQDINNNIVDVNSCANTLTAQHQRPTINSATLIKTPLRIRKLTPKECWRLMGINDQDFEKAQEVVSNSQLYKQAGNGIVVDVFAAILKGLFKEERDER